MAARSRGFQSQFLAVVPNTISFLFAPKLLPGEDPEDYYGLAFGLYSDDKPNTIRGWLELHQFVQEVWARNREDRFQVARLKALAMQTVRRDLTTSAIERGHGANQSKLTILVTRWAEGNEGFRSALEEELGYDPDPAILIARGGPGGQTTAAEIAASASAVSNMARNIVDIHAARAKASDAPKR
jgi:hypothetical protein